MSILWPILKGAALRLKRRAVVDDQRTYTYGRLLGGAFFVADAIAAATDRPRVGLMLPTSGAFPISLLATWITGKTAVPLNYLLKKEDLHHVIDDSEIDTIITVGPMLEFLGGREVLPENVKLIQLEQLDFTGLPPFRWPARARGDDLAALLYTSGTSGKPKGVMLTHNNLRANVIDCIVHSNLNSANTFLGVLPQFHSFGLTVLTILPLMIGSPVVYTARFVPKKIVDLIREHRPDVFIGIPSMYKALLSVKSAAAEDLKSIRIAIAGGEPMPDAVFEQFQEKFNIRILEGYGLTETSPVANWSTPDANRRHAVGRPLPRVTEMIVDDNDQPLGPGEDGEILIAGPNIMRGYLNMPEETAAVLDNLTGPDGVTRRFFRTGDIGRFDEDGFLYITGRKKEMMIIGGENVFPREIEEVLNKHPSVQASGVIGVADESRGEIAVAFVETIEGETFDEAALKNLCREHLPGYKVPRQIYPVEQLPRNPTGKILRRELEVPNDE